MVWRIGAFELWCWRRLLRAPRTARRSKQSILKEISPEYSLANPLATWSEELTHWKRPRCWERLKAGGEGTTEDEMVGWHHWLNGHEFEQTPGVGDGQGHLACCSPCGHKKLVTQKEFGHKKLSAWTNFCWFFRWILFFLASILLISFSEVLLMVLCL